MADLLSKKELNINVEHVTRVEGHGSIVINVKEGKLEECQLHIVEAPRFFEAMVKGRSMFEVQYVTSRICGICSTGHSMASIKAAEDAIGFKPSDQTTKLRKLLLHLETLDSHLLHAFMLVAPDALGAPSVFPLLGTHKDAIVMVLKMKRQYSNICDVLAGRRSHPIAICPRGWTKLPTKKELEWMKGVFVSQVPDLTAAVDLLASLKLPDFERETEYVALTHPDEYAFLEGEMTTTDIDGVVERRNYKDVIHEYHVAHSTSKHSKNKRDSYMVGALARINVNYDKLNDEAKGVAEKLGFKTPCYNPFMNTVAQVIEMAHCTYDAIRIIDDLLENGVDYSDVVTSWPTKDELPGLKMSAGSGVGIVEVPRGLLVHNYDVDKEGIVTGANCVIPTNQNLANIDLDMKKMVPEVIDSSKEEITLLAEMLVRAYDPCISCSCHLLDVKFV